MRARKILIIEDDATIRECIQELLEMEGYEIETAPQGRAALERLKSNPALPGLILLDFHMPVMNGEQFIQALKLEGEPYSSIPVLLMSAVPNVTVAGVSGILRKPIALQSILESVNALYRTESE